jgi:hypothetical protein
MAARCDKLTPTVSPMSTASRAASVTDPEQAPDLDAGEDDAAPSLTATVIGSTRGRGCPWRPPASLASCQGGGRSTKLDRPVLVQRRIGSVVPVPGRTIRAVLTAPYIDRPTHRAVVVGDHSAGQKPCPILAFPEEPNASGLARLVGADAADRNEREWPLAQRLAQCQAIGSIWGIVPPCDTALDAGSWLGTLAGNQPEAEQQRRQRETCWVVGAPRQPHCRLSALGVDARPSIAPWVAATSR